MLSGGRQRMTTCNCIGRFHPGCCLNRWSSHYMPNMAEINPFWCPGCHRNIDNGECICNKMQADKDKQKHDLIWQLEERLTKLEGKAEKLYLLLTDKREIISNCLERLIDIEKIQNAKS